MWKPDGEIKGEVKPNMRDQTHIGPFWHHTGYNGRIKTDDGLMNNVA